VNLDDGKCLAAERGLPHEMPPMTDYHV